MADRIIFKNTTQEANIESIQVTDVLNGEILLVRETNKEHLYCKNSNGEISKIHRITDCGGFPSSTTSSYEAVDLGLPSGLLWANKNIGAETEEDAGLYFQWGDTQGYTAEQVGVDKEFSSDFSDYKFGIYPDFTKYNRTDGLITLEEIDDAATQIMGGEWRMPTMDEFTELINNTEIYCINSDGEEIPATLTRSGFFQFTKEYIIKGIKFYNKTDSSKYIVIPAGGRLDSNSIQELRQIGNVWYSTLYDIDYGCCFLFIGRTGIGESTSNHPRYYGLPIRAVKPQQ